MSGVGQSERGHHRRRREHPSLNPSRHPRLHQPRISAAPSWLRCPRTQRTPEKKGHSLAEREGLPPPREEALAKGPPLRDRGRVEIPEKGDTCPRFAI